MAQLIAASVTAVPALVRSKSRWPLGGSIADLLCVAVPTRLAGSVLPRVGTGGFGRTFPGAVVPFGLVQLSPDTAGHAQPQWWRQGRNVIVYPWEHCSGYFYPDNVIRGFSHTHLSGTGCPELGDVLLMPGTGPVRWYHGGPGWQHDAQRESIGSHSGWVARKSGYASRFAHQHETAHPGYYSVLLEDFGVLAELTATARCGMHRYTFPAGKPGHVILDLVHALSETVYEAQVNIENTTTISGYRGTHGWAPYRQVYFVMEFSRPFASCLVQKNGVVHAGEIGSVAGPKLKAAFNFSESGGEQLVIKLGISGTGVEGARKNLRAEIPHWNFNQVAARAAEQWDKALGVLEADLPNEGLAQVFYTAAYHGMIGPTTFNDVDGKYRGEDRRNHAPPGFTNYTTLSIWDIYRAEFPFIMLAQPQRTDDTVKTLLAGYRQLNAHALPIWPLWGNETWAMTGFHAVGMILGAYTRGFRGYDVEAAYAAMRDTALMGATANGSREMQAAFRYYGYLPTTPQTAARTIGHEDQKQAVSRTLDFAYDYWCVGAMAELLGKHDDAKMFYKFGQNYKNLFDPKTGFMRGKTADGQWREGTLRHFHPDEDYWPDYTESDAWQATFNVMQDVHGLIELYGGDQQFISKLDALFTAPSHIRNYDVDITGMVGQDAQGNEPSNHIPYLYPFAGAAWKTQYWVRKVATLYNNSPSGIPGNDDCGQLSSWLVLTAMGFYPVNPATGVYVIGSPLINRAKIHNPATGTTFTIIAENNSAENLYIQSAKLNGCELTRSWFTHANIVAGGELYFHMGRKPNKDWASDPASRPPSGLLNVVN
jgi:predicted alpha-1,2-mannosidase